MEKGLGIGREGARRWNKTSFPWLHKLLTFTCCMYKIKLINNYFDIFQLSQKNSYWADFGKVFKDR